MFNNVSSNSRLRPRGINFGGRLNVYRIYTAAAAILVFGLKVMVVDPENTFDPLAIRLSLSLFFVLILAASFFSDWVKERMEGLYAVGMTLLAGWMCLLMQRNSFAAEFMSGFNILSIVSILLFENRRLMAFFTIASSIMLAVATVTVGSPPDGIWIFLGLNLTVFLIGNVAVAARSATRTNLEISLSHLLTIQEAAVESNSDGIMLVDQEGNYLKANTAFCHLWGISQEIIEGNRLEEGEKFAMAQAVHPEEVRKIWSGNEGGMSIGELREIEFLDGRIVESCWRPMINGDVLIGRLWIFRDITQRRNRERQLLENERRLRGQNERLMEFATSFVTNAGNLEASYQEITSVSADLLGVDTVGLWLFDKNAGTMSMHLQYDRETATFSSGATVSINAHPAYFEALFKNRVLVVNDTLKDATTQPFYKGEYSGRALALMHAQIQAQGERIGFMSFECAHEARQWTADDQHYAASLADLVSIAMASDHRQRAQDELSSSHAIMQAIFDLSETGIIVEDSEHNILKYNELYLRIWNMSKEFVETQPYPVLLARCLEQLKNSESIQEGLDKIKIRPGMEYAGIMEFHDGTIVERYSKAINVGETLKGRVWFYLDITERKRKELELINRNFELDSFVYRASHDLKAPLNSIMGLIGLIREEHDLDTILRYVTMMDKSVKKLDDFIRQLTQFSQDARLKIVRKPIDFKEMVDDILADLRFMDNAARLAITIDVQQAKTFHSDPVRLSIVFSNFLSNAIKYQDLKKEKSTLLIQIVADETQAVCRFEDNGLGIDADHLEKVFDLFFRASVQATGSGLGLYITHNAIQKLGGNVKVTSELGKGTAFVLTVPNVVAAEDDVVATKQDIETQPV